MRKAGICVNIRAEPRGLTQFCQLCADLPGFGFTSVFFNSDRQTETPNYPGRNPQMPEQRTTNSTALPGARSARASSTVSTQRRYGLIAVAAALAVALAIAAWQWFHPQATSARMAMANGDFERAAFYYKKAAADGNKVASNSLGNLYYLGLGVELDYVKASELYFEAASAGIADAQMNLAHLFTQGLGVAPDRMRAFAWYSMADQFGNPMAEYYLLQISQEWTLSPLQISTAMEKWSKLPALVAEGL